MRTRRTVAEYKVNTLNSSFPIIHLTPHSHPPPPHAMNPDHEKEIELPATADTPPGYGNHHLCWDDQKKRWSLRVTVDMGPKVVGKRICVRFAATDLVVAVIKRDAILAAFKALGLVIRPRLQKRSEGDA